MSFGGTFSQFLALVDTANIIHQNAFVKYFNEKYSKILPQKCDYVCYNIENHSIEIR